MADAMLAGLPRLVRVAAETRWRGQIGAAIAASVAAYSLLVWLLDGPVDVMRTIAAAATAFAAALLAAGIVSRRRLREGLGRVRRTPRPVVYETLADGRERRARAGGVLLLAAVVLLVFDRVTAGEGVMAGLLIGIGLGIGLVELVEARRWDRAERDRDSRLFLLVRPNALLARYAGAEVYEDPRAERDRDPASSGRFP